MTTVEQIYVQLVFETYPVRQANRLPYGTPQASTCATIPSLLQKDKMSENDKDS